MNGRHTPAEKKRRAAERQAITRLYRPSARELFPALRERLLASRPEVGVRARFVPNRTGRLVAVQETVYGAPTFRNVIEGGDWK